MSAGQGGPEQAAEKVVLARKSYEHLIRTRDRALRAVEWETERRKGTEDWARRECAEQRRLTDRLNEVCYAAAALGVPIQTINDALAKADAQQSSRPGQPGGES